MTNRFEHLTLEGWRQFDDVDIVLHPRLTVITGANGSGKSTILSLFTRHFGWNRNYLSTPVRDKLGNTSYLSGILNSFWHKLKITNRDNSHLTTIGQIRYSNGVTTTIGLNKNNGIQYQVEIPSQQQVLGIHVDSYRPVPLYSTIVQIPMTPITADQAYNNYNSEVMTRYQLNSYTGTSPIVKMKEALISMAIFGEGNTAIGKNQALIELSSGFNSVLKKLLPETLGFERISIRTPEVVLVTKSGEFMLDAVSGGVMTLIDIAWRIFMYSQNNKSFVVTMDEPENHLHPSMQRSLMRRLLDAFPDVQFIIATHSPFMVSSVKDSSVYVLKYEQMNGPTSEVTSDALSRVSSMMLGNLNKAGTASEILRDVLGVPATMPEWVENGLENIVKEFQGQPITRDLLANLRARLSEFGYDEYYPQALAGVTKQ